MTSVILLASVRFRRSPCSRLTLILHGLGALARLFCCRRGYVHVPDIEIAIREIEEALQGDRFPHNLGSFQRRQVAGRTYDAEYWRKDVVEELHASIGVWHRVHAAHLKEPLLLVFDRHSEGIQGVASLLVKWLQGATHAHDYRRAKRGGSSRAEPS